MLYYRCSHCGKRVPRGEKCGCSFKREYTAPDGTRRLYHTARWTRLQRTIMQRYNGLDPYALNIGKRIETADTVHHIVPAEEDPSKFWDPDNLIPVSRHSHDEIHTVYRTGGEDKAQLQSQLQSLVHRCESTLLGG